MIVFFLVFILTLIIWQVCYYTDEKYKKNYYISPFVALIYSIFIGGATEISDYPAYLNAYNTCLNNFYFNDIGYMILNVIFYVIGIEFDGFRTISAFLFLAILFIIVERYLRDRIAFLIFIILYLLYPLPIDAIQVRNWMMDVLFIVFFILYVDHNQSKKYLSLLLTSVSFHITGAIYIFLNILVWLKSKKYIRMLVNTMFFMGILLPFYAQNVKLWSLSITDFIFQYSMYANYGNYFFSTINYGYLVGYAFCFGNVIWLRFNLKKIKNERTKLYIKSLYNWFFALCCIAPIFVFSGDILRIPRNMLPLSYIAYLLLLSEIKYNMSNKLFWINTLVILCLGKGLSFYDFPYFGWVEMIESLAAKNYIFSIFY